MTSRRRCSRRPALRGVFLRGVFLRGVFLRGVFLFVASLLVVGLESAGPAQAVLRKPAARSKVTRSRPKPRPKAVGAAAVTTTVPSEPTTSLPPPVPTVGTTASSSIAFTYCDTVECADVPVPLNPNDPAGERVTLFVSRRRATGPAPRIGVLFVNPGGPGGPAFDLVRNAGLLLNADVLARYDVIGVDPRGTARSAALKCDNGRLGGGFTSDAVALYDYYSTTCARTDGDRLQYLDTQTAALDLEAVRVALGEEKISYVGLSYGTYLGAVYRAMFAGHVRSMVLDSAIDPARFGVNQLLDRVAATDSALDGFLDECASGRLSPCNFNDGSDLRAKYVRIREEAIASSPRGRDRAEQSFDHTIADLIGYPRNGWPVLGRALQEQATNQRPNFTTTAADSKSTDDREHAAPTDVFSVATNLAISCRDGILPRDPGAYQTVVDQTPVVSSRLGGLRVDAVLAKTCVAWPAAVASLVLLGPQAVPTLVIANTYDLTTPYKWSQGLAVEIGAALLTRNGGGHVALDKSACVREAAARFLLDGAVPVAGTVCSPSLENPT